MIEKLKLSEDQERKFRSFRFEKMEKEIELESQMKMNRLKMKRLVTDDDFRKEDLLKPIDKRSELMSKMARINTQFWYDVRNILNKDQQAIWNELINRIILRGEGINSNDKSRITRDRMKRRPEGGKGFRKESRNIKD